MYVFIMRGIYYIRKRLIPTYANNTTKKISV